MNTRPTQQNLPQSGCHVFRRLALRCLAPLLLLSACEQLGKPEANTLYADAKPPVKQEFRWSNGKAPKTLDPALASAAPETDVVRALYEGLTELEPKTLAAIPAAAERWESSSDFKQWTFYIRDDARWSNGEPLTAGDFVRSWRRAAALGKSASFPSLFFNIVGFREISEAAAVSNKESAKTEASSGDSASPRTNESAATQPLKTPRKAEPPSAENAASKSGEKSTASGAPGVVADGPKTLKIFLVDPDEAFPKLVAHPVFRPVYGSGKLELVKGFLPETITNGAFRLEAAGPDGITLEKSEEYWNREAVKLERVKFVPADSAEEALEAYKNGKVDAVTNAEFSPLALKLLSPFEDFRSTAFSALNLYEINTSKAPFDDRRIRRALAISIERSRLTDGELEGSTQPALRFLPFGTDPSAELVEDPKTARDLLADAGFPDGNGFPIIRLVVNRNATQMRIARLVVRMWKQNLNIETEIIVKETAEMEKARAAMDFDVLRRGVVFPTPNETANLEAIFGSRKEFLAASDRVAAGETPPNANPETSATALTKKSESPDTSATAGKILSEEGALLEMLAIPLYFPSSYSLLKPYVMGFEVNSLDAPLLYDVSIDSGWRPDKQRPNS